MPGDYIDYNDCVDSGRHRTDVDEDGYCNGCGEQY
jgi:hypothetical protein